MNLPAPKHAADHHANRSPARHRAEAPPPPRYRADRSARHRAVESPAPPAPPAPGCYIDYYAYDRVPMSLPLTQRRGSPTPAEVEEKSKKLWEAVGQERARQRKRAEAVLQSTLPPTPDLRKDIS